MKKFLWNWKMAWRDSRKSRGRLVIFTSSIILGIATLVAIQSFRESLTAKIESEAKTLLGADMVARSNEGFNDEMQSILDSAGGEQASEKAFASMVFVPKNGNTRLVYIRALEGNFPFYGSLEALPESAGSSFREGKKALMDETMMIQLDVQTGDSIRVGKVNFQVEGSIAKSPGQAGIAATVAPPVYIPLRYLPETGLMRMGSRVISRVYFKFPEKTDVEKIAGSIRAPLQVENVRLETVNDRREMVGDAFDNLYTFLNLVGFVALLLGCIGVASAVHIYIKDKIPVVAVLRCMGVQGKDAFTIFLLQILAMGAIGSILGVILGSLLQVALPAVLADFLVVDVEFVLSWSAIFTGLIIGMVVSFLFALVPLLSIRKTSPIRVLSSFYDDATGKSDRLVWLVYGLITICILGFAWWQTGALNTAAIFVGALIVIFGLLIGIAKLLTFLIRKYFPVSWSYVWRQGLANLFRPDNQTLVLMITIGLGTTLLANLYFIQNNLIGQIAGLDQENQPNMILFDIKADQSEAVASFTESFDMPVIQRVPVVSMRLEEIKGVRRDSIKNDTSSTVPGHILNREWRVTYRDSLIASEELIKGSFTRNVKVGDVVSVSIEERTANQMGVSIGDPLKFNVQGMMLDVVVSSIRSVNWTKVQTNFTIVFPRGVLEKAPQFYALITRTPGKEVSAKYQRELVSQFPNISVIDLEVILKTAEEVLGQISFVIRFMSLFSVLTGLIVLIGSVVNSKFQRIQESVLLRTLGARRRQIQRIAMVEYTALGSMAVLTGVILSMAYSWAMSVFVFKLPFHPDWVSAGVIYVVITSITVLIGMLNNRSVVQQSPLEVLRKEV